jgi:hypothetical protein
MRILRPIVELTANLLSIGDADVFHRRGIRAKPIGRDGLGAVIFLHDALQKLQRCSLVPLRGDQAALSRFGDHAFQKDGVAIAGVLSKSV